MEKGEWYREKIFNLQNGKEEWKYYNIKEVIPGNNSVEIDVYKIYYTGKISAPRKYYSPMEVIEKCTKVSADYAYSILKIKPEEENNGAVQ